MKKTLLTLSMVALFVFAVNAQDDKKANAIKNTTTTTKEVVNPDGTISVAEDKTTTGPTKAEEPKKTGTRMAINEKGTSGTKNQVKKEAAKEIKTETENSPASKPH